MLELVGEVLGPYSAIVSIGALGVLASTGLGVAARFLFVPVNPKISQLREVLPSINCGACGYPGCDGYSKGIVEEDADLNRCAPGGQDLIPVLANIMGVEGVEDLDPEVAIVLCGGSTEFAWDKYEYTGPKDCNAAALIGGGPKGCVYGCMGLASCAEVCPYDAIEITTTKMAIVIPEKCTGCTLCVPACPKDLIKMVPASAETHIICSSRDIGKDTKVYCEVGCTACKICVKQSDEGSMIIPEGENLAVMDYDIALDWSTHNLKVEAKCPTHSIVDYRKQGPVVWNVDLRDQIDDEDRIKAAKKAAAMAKKKAKAEAEQKKAAAAAGDTSPPPPAPPPASPPPPAAA